LRKSLGARSLREAEVKLVTPGRTYRPVSSRSFYESDYVASILLIADEIFPGFMCSRFSPLVESEHGAARPDLVLVDKLYRNWFVIEVELEHHSLSAHVEPQIRRLSSGFYSDSHATRLHDLLPDSSLQDLVRLLRSSQPGVVVIAPEMRQAWVDALKTFGATLMVLQVFEDDLGNRIFNVDGEEVKGLESHVVGTAQRTAAIRTGLSVSGISDDSLGTEVDLLFEDEMTRWKVVRTNRDVLLLPRGRCPLPEKMTESYTITSYNGTWRLETIGH
jgi:hypothetical protein